MTNESSGFPEGAPGNTGETGASTSWSPARPSGYGTAGYPTSETAYPASTGTSSPARAFPFDHNAADDTDTPSVTEVGQEAAAAAGEVKDEAVSKAVEVKDEAIAKAVEVKDEAVERGADLAAVAKEEFANVTGEFRDQVQSLWNQASGQLREQASSGQQQVADLLHSLAGELGHLASRSEQDGPLTAFARSASAQGGEWSHWLSTTDTSDVLAELKRLARRRPLAFLAGAAAAGVLVGRLSRSLMANSKADSAAALEGASAPAAGPSYSPASAVGPGTTELAAGDAVSFGPGALGGSTVPVTTGQELR